MGKYQKKPVVVEAMRVEKPYKRVAEWCGGYIIKEDVGNAVCGVNPRQPKGVYVHAPFAGVGDWIVFELGEYLVVDDACFDATYEAIDAPTRDGEG